MPLFCEVKVLTDQLTGTVSPKQGCPLRSGIWRKQRTKVGVDEQKQDTRLTHRVSWH